MRGIAYKLSAESSKKLLERFAPKFAVTKCDHITVAFGLAEGATLPSHAEPLEVIAYVTDTIGVECLVVSVGGTTTRSDGSTFHITLSRNADRKSVESNKVIADCPWQKLTNPISIEAEMGWIE